MRSRLLSMTQTIMAMDTSSSTTDHATNKQSRCYRMEKPTDKDQCDQEGLRCFLNEFCCRVEKG